MLKGFFVPNTAAIKHENLLGFLAAEDQVGVKGVGVPHEGGGHTVRLYFLQITNINVNTVNVTEKTCFMEDNLLGMGE
jgi:hypothetical protein